MEPTPVQHFSLACVCISTMASRHDAIAIQTRTMHTSVKGGPQPKDEHSFAGEVRVCYELQPHAASSQTYDGSSVRMQDDKRHGFQPPSATTSHDGVWRPGECATVRRWICDLSPLSSRDEKIGGTHRQTAPPARSDASSDPRCEKRESEMRDAGACACAAGSVASWQCARRCNAAACVRAGC